MKLLSDSTTYYLDWFEEGKRNRSIFNHRILLYGNFFMHAARYASMKACRCIADCICTNRPINEVQKELMRHLTAHSYSLVVLGESVSLGESSCAEYVGELQTLFPYTKFVLATAPSTWMLPPRYCANEQCRVYHNNRCREIAAQEKIPCLDIDFWANEMGLQSPDSVKNVKLKLACHYLKQCRISKAFKTLRTQHTSRNLMQMTHTLLSLRLGEAVRKLIRKGIPAPEIVWTNKWHHDDAHALIIGDSNTRALCRANEYLSSKVDMFATSAPMIDSETYAAISDMLTPNISRICFSIGAHYLHRWQGPCFEKQLSEFLMRLQAEKRRVLLLTVTEWSDKKDYSKPDETNNILINRLNIRLKAVAAELGIEVLDLHSIMKGNPFDDYVHYVKAAYDKPAASIANWLQFGTFSN